MSMNRRELVRAGALVGAGVAVSGGVVVKDRLAKSPPDPVGEKTVRNLTVLNNIKPQLNEDVLVRMQRDLVKAMAKPVEQRRWIMVIDTRKCVGCHACTIGCVAENKLPPGVVYRPVVTEEFGEFPNVQLRFTPRPWSKRSQLALVHMTIWEFQPSPTCGPASARSPVCTRLCMTPIRRGCFWCPAISSY